MMLMLANAVLIVAGLVLLTFVIARVAERIVPPRGQFVDIGDERIHYVDKGRGPALVFIHGLGGQLGNFSYALLDRLSDRFRVILIDRPGAGYSTRSRSLTLANQAETIAAFLAARGVDRPLIIGHSLGGAVALTLALNRPGLIRGLALIAPLTVPRDSVPAPFGLLGIRSLLLRTIVAWTIATPLSILGRSRVLPVLFDPDRPPAAFAVKGGGLLTLRPRAFVAASSDLVAAADEMPALVTRYAELQMPVAVLFGRGDRVLGAIEQGEGLRNLLPSIRLDLVDGGHMLPVTQPDLVAAWIAGVANDVFGGAEERVS